MEYLTVPEDVDTLKCPKCKTIWREKGEYDYDFGGWHYPDGSEYCPNGCVNKFGIKAKGKIQKRSE